MGSVQAAIQLHAAHMVHAIMECAAALPATLEQIALNRAVRMVAADMVHAIMECAAALHATLEQTALKLL